jgi:capsule polysaccharide export protein KpsE/RkpR
MVVTYLILLILPNKYTSKARLLPPQQNITMSGQLLSTLGGGGVPGAPMTGGGLAGMAPGFLGLKTPSDLYAAMLTGTTIFDRIIEQFNLRKRYKEKYIEGARKTLSKKAKIDAQKDGMITIEITDRDPKRAAEMANAFVEELNKLLQGLAIQEAKSRMDFLERERLQTSQNLTKAENTLRTFSEQNNVIQIDTQTRGALEYIAQLRAEIDAKEVRVQVMRQQATPYNYDMVRLETEIKGLRDKLANAEKQHDQACAGDICLTTAKVPALGLEYMRLYREVKFQDALYQLYTKMVELARLDMVKDFALVQVVDQALPPEKKSNKRLLPTALAGIITCLMMIIIAFCREYWQHAKAREENSRRLSLIRDNLKWWARPFRRF